MSRYTKEQWKEMFSILDRLHEIAEEDRRQLNNPQEKEEQQ